MSEELNFITKDIVEQEFENDPLFKDVRVKLIPLKRLDLLLPDFLTQLNIDQQYSTMQVADFINNDNLLGDKGIQDTHLRYYMRPTNLEDYISPILTGRHYRLNYISVYKLYLITISIQMLGQNIKDLKQLFPDKYAAGQVVRGGKNTTPMNDAETNRIIEAMKYLLANSIHQSKNMNEAIKFIKERYEALADIHKEVDELNDNIIDKKTLLIEEKDKLSTLQLDVAKKDRELAEKRSIERSEIIQNNTFKILREAKKKKRLFNFSKEKELEESDLQKVNTPSPAILELANEIDEKVKELSSFEESILKLEREIAEEEKRKNEVSKKMSVTLYQIEELEKLMLDYDSSIEKLNLLGLGFGLVTKGKDTDDNLEKTEKLSDITANSNVTKEETEAREAEIVTDTPNVEDANTYRKIVN